MKIFTCCQERSRGGKLGVKEVEGMINRARVSRGGGRGQMEGLALTWRKSHCGPGEEGKMESEVSVFRCWEGCPGGSNRLAVLFSCRKEDGFAESGDVGGWREPGRGGRAAENGKRTGQHSLSDT